jgi:predicted ATP-grasp superfamily ATP-dependent carboligase
VIEPGRKILKGIGFYGYACTEFKQDPRDGIYKLMEVNGRHNLSSLLAVRCGINFPWLQYQHLVFGQLPSAADFRKDVYWIDITRDVGYSLQYLGKEKYRLGQYLRPYLRPHVYAILDLADPAPFVRRVVYLAGEASRTVIAALRRRVRHLSSGRKDPTVDGT